MDERQRERERWRGKESAHLRSDLTAPNNEMFIKYNFNIRKFSILIDVNALNVTWILRHALDLLHIFVILSLQSLLLFVEKNATFDGKSRS